MEGVIKAIKRHIEDLDASVSMAQNVGVEHVPNVNTMTLREVSYVHTRLENIRKASMQAARELDSLVKALE